MGKVLTHMAMSLDGYIANPEDSPDELFDWYWGGDVTVPSFQDEMTFQVDEASAEMLRDLLEHRRRDGRRPTPLRHHQRLGRPPPGAPAVVVVTHTPPEERRALAEDDLRRRGGGGHRQGAGDRR